MKTVRALGASLAGTTATVVTVEARYEARERAKAEILLTGLPDPVLRESRGRIESALNENGLSLAGGRLFVNLVPAALKKSGEILDLPIALASAAACGFVDARVLKDAVFLGELGIDGRLHPVPGGLAAALAAKERGARRLFAPPATAGEAACVPELEVYAPRHLAQVLAHLAGGATLLPRVAPAVNEEALRPTVGSLDDVRGQTEAKHALAIAAAGGHGLLLAGPPGTGKTMLARRLVRLLPPPSLDERLEITRALSAAGRWPGGLARERPFRAPHHTVSYAGLVGGGPNVLPGEITLAHRGVLFLDELPEFRREVLEALRQPLEEGRVLLSRATRHVELPAAFQLVTAMNPCPCGYRGHPRIPCACPPSLVQRYRRRISGPLLDRIDLHVEMPSPSVDELARATLADDTREAELAASVAQARERAQARGTPNSKLVADELDRSAPLDSATRDFLDKAARRRGLSARAVQSLRRVARTIADLANEDRVALPHYAQALALRANLA